MLRQCIVNSITLAYVYFKSLLLNLRLQVKGVMVSNIEKVTQRGDKLDDLGERAGMYT